jgi:hypothetical protein
VKYKISKSSYIRGIQCDKSLYLYKYFFKDRDPLPEERKLRFRAGHNVGFKARSLFPGGVDLTPPHVSRYPVMARQTAEFIEKKEPVLYEAAFIYDEVLAVPDILVYQDGWHAYEVKSSVQISETYFRDAALQYFVINGSGLQLKDFSIIHLTKNHKEITGDESNDELFQFTSVLDRCRSQHAVIGETIQHLKKILNAPGIPKIDMGDHCRQPYDCDFQGFCKRQRSLLNAKRIEFENM